MPPVSPTRTLTAELSTRAPPHAWFAVSAIFHYLGPAFAVLLFAYVEPLGVAWLRIATAALVFAAWRRPWQFWRRLSTTQRVVVVQMGVVLGAMNCAFYEAIDRLPLGTVGAIEFLGPIGLAAIGARSSRNSAALALVIAGVSVLTEVRLTAQPLGYLFAFANCALFVLYIVLGHRLAADGATSGIDRLGAAMVVAAVVTLPFGVWQASAAFASPLLLAAAFGVGVSSSVIPYVCDQLAMARLRRATFALLLALLPATAALIGMVVLRQVPVRADLLGVALVIGGISVHRQQRRQRAGEARRCEGDLE